MSRTDIGWIALLIIVGVCLLVVLWWVLSIEKACGDKGGDLFWGNGFRQVCVSHSNEIIP